VMGSCLLVRLVRGLGWNALDLMLLARPTSQESECLKVTEIAERDE